MSKEQEKQKTHYNESINPADLTESEWALRMQDWFSDLITADSLFISYAIPPGWRELVEEKLDEVLEHCELNGLSPSDEAYPRLFRMECFEGQLLMQMANAGYFTLQTLHEAMTNASDLCEQCGEKPLRLETCEFELKDPPRLVPKTYRRRLCPDCAEAISPKADPARSLQVMSEIPGSEERHADKVLEAYNKALVKRRTPVTTIPDLAFLRDTLNREFPWLSATTEKIMRSLVPRQAGLGWFKLHPMLLWGPPGAGKTSYIQRLAELSGTPWRLIPLAGENSSMVLKGNSRGWSTARPSAALEMIKEKATANPIIVLDELDKAGGSNQNGKVADVLVQLLETQTASQYYDSYLQSEADLSAVSWIATANEYRHLPAPLLSRFELVRVDMPRREHYKAIVEKTMASYARDCGIHPEMMPQLDGTLWQSLSRFFTSPRAARRATETLLGALLANPGLTGQRLQ